MNSAFPGGNSARKVQQIMNQEQSYIDGVYIDNEKLMNDPANVVDEMIEGYVKAFPNYVQQLAENKRALVAVREESQKWVF